MEREIWKDVIGYEGRYQVSNMGRVRSLPKEWVGGNGSRRKHNGKILKGTYHSGYYQIKLSKEGKVKTFNVHQLVAMAFLGHVPDGHKRVVDHKNNDKLNNNVSNLQLITNRENTSKDKSGYTSKHTGVSWSKQRSKWDSRIIIGYKTIHLGYFDDEEEAGMYYQLALSNISNYDGDAKEFRNYLQSIS